MYFFKNVIRTVLIHNTYCHQNASHSVGDSPSVLSCISHIEFEVHSKLRNLETVMQHLKKIARHLFFNKTAGLQLFFLGWYLQDSFPSCKDTYRYFFCVTLQYYTVYYILNFEIGICPGSAISHGYKVRQFAQLSPGKTFLPCCIS